MFDYRACVVDAELFERLTSIGAVLIDGPKGCGKTETDQVRRHADDLRRRGLYILTGSATPRYERELHSGAARIGSLDTSARGPGV